MTVALGDDILKINKLVIRVTSEMLTMKTGLLWALAVQNFNKSKFPENGKYII